MNKRIQALAEQAIDYFCDNEKSKIMDEKVLENFAELILRECISQIEEVAEIKVGHAGREYTQGFLDGMFVAASTIEEHFGIE